MISFTPTNENLQNLETMNNYLYVELLNKRKQRYRNALRDSLAQNNLLVTGLAPTLESLQFQLAHFEKINLIHNSQEISQTITNIQNRINSGEYAKENDLDFQKRQQINSHRESFIWPDANEIVIRQQEEIELLELLNQ